MFEHRISSLAHQIKDWVDMAPLSILVTPIIYFFEKYVISDWDSFSLVMITLVGDTVLGVYKHWRRKTLNKEGLAKFVDKLMVCFFALFLSEKVASLSGDISIWEDIATGFGRASLIMYLGMSIAENLSDISNGKFPSKALLDKFKVFTEKKRD